MLNSLVVKSILDKKIESGCGSDDYMTKENPTGTGAFSMNRKAGTEIGLRSAAEGFKCEASGADSHAEGSYTTASASSSHAEGTSCSATAQASHAEGNSTTASERDSHAEGDSTTASGQASHAEGFKTKASGPNSHAEGVHTEASGYYSHAEGLKTKASGSYSHSGGNSTIAGYRSQTAIGEYNDNKEEDIFEVGNGTSNTARSNALELTKTGDLKISGSYIDGSGNVLSVDSANEYTDQKIADLINGAPTTLDTLKEIADAMEKNQNVVKALDKSIGTKANSSDLTGHTSDTNNPHNVTAEQLGLGDVVESEVATDFSEAETPKFQQTIDDVLYGVNELKGDLVHIGDEVNSTNNKVNDNSKNIEDNKTDITEIQQILDRLTELKEVVLTDENKEAISTEQGELLTAMIRYIKTDSTLKNEFLPANSKAVGDKIEYEANRIRAETKFDYSKFGLPVLYLNGDISGMSKNNKKTLSYKYNNRSGNCTVKWQGSSSIAYPKKNYTIEFDNSFEAKSGWGNHKKYCLKANWIDFSHARNIISARLWGDLVKSRSDDNIIDEITTENGDIITTEDSNELTTYNNRLATKVNGGAVDGFPICVVINKEYKGIYTFNIPKEAWLFDMGAGNQECILCADDSNNHAVEFKGNANLDGSDFKIEYITDKNNTTWAKDSLNRLIQLCIDCDSNAKYQEIKNYIDIQSAIDYYIFVCLLQAEDCIFRNYILVTFDGVKWYFSAYDLDQTFGLGENGKRFYPLAYNTATNMDKLLYNNRLFYLIYTYDYDSLKARYWEVRETVMSEKNIYNKVVDFSKDIPLALKNHEVHLWNGLPSTDVNSIEQMINYYRLRVIDQDKKVSKLEREVINND